MARHLTADDRDALQWAVEAIGGLPWSGPAPEDIRRRLERLEAMLGDDALDIMFDDAAMARQGGGPQNPDGTWGWLHYHRTEGPT